MPCVSAQFDPNIGLLINIGVFAPDTFEPTEPLTFFPALIDTGASITCISTTIAQSVNIQPVGMRQMCSATHTAVPVNIYLVDIIVPFGKVGHALKAIQVMEFESNSPYQMLIGRDIICKGILSMSFDGHFTFAL